MSNETKHFTQSNLFLGIILMILHSLAMSVVYISGKQLGKVIASDQIALLYKFGVLICTIPLIIKDGIKKTLHTKRLKLHFLRAIFSLLATLCFYRGLLQVPALDATAITFIEPIIVLLVGIIYFKESISTTKLLLVALCMIGVLLIIKPGFVSFNSYYFYLFGALIFWAMNSMSIKVLGRTEKTTTSLFYVSMFSTIFAIPIALNYKWNAFELKYVMYIVLMTVCHMIHMVCFYRALKLADISSVMPFDYTRLFFTGILAFFVLNEQPNRLSILGYILIALSGILMICYETHKHKKFKNKIK